MFLLLAVSRCTVQKVLEDDLALAGWQIVKEILWCHLDEPAGRGEVKKNDSQAELG